MPNVDAGYRVFSQSSQSKPIMNATLLLTRRSISNSVKSARSSNGATFGYYVLNALAKSGDIDTGLDFISQYWGGMLDAGATTFWEDFDLAWTKDAGR